MSLIVSLSESVIMNMDVGTGLNKSSGLHMKKQMYANVRMNFKAPREHGRQTWFFSTSAQKYLIDYRAR